MADIEISIDLSRFLNAIEEASQIVGDGAKRGLHDVMDEWLIKSRDVAPLDKGTLRRSMSTDIKGSGIDLTGEISAAAIEVAKKGKWAGQRFNYAYYLHEVYPKKHGESFKNPTTPGTIPQYLDKPAKQNEDKWKQHIEKEIEKALREKGW
jgi:hypothetical protein